jgi:hypothetical protein
MRRRTRAAATLDPGLREQQYKHNYVKLRYHEQSPEGGHDK